MSAATPYPSSKGAGAASAPQKQDLSIKASSSVELIEGSANEVNRIAAVLAPIASSPRSKIQQDNGTMAMSISKTRVAEAGGTDRNSTSQPSSQYNEERLQRTCRGIARGALPSKRIHSKRGTSRNHMILWIERRRCGSSEPNTINERPRRIAPAPMEL